MTFEEWSNKKKKKSSSFEEWSNANRSISKEQEEEDERKRKEYLSSRKNDDIAPVKEEKKTDRESTFKSSSGKTHGGGGGNFGKTTAEENRTWFKEGEGSVWERILGSMTDAGENVSSGFIGIGEKVVDAMTTMGAVMNRSNMMKAAESEILLNTLSGKESEGVFDKYQKKQEEWEKEVGDFVAKDLYDEEKIVKSGTKAVAEKILNEPMRKVVLDEEKYSVFGDKSDALAQSAGQLGGQLAVSAIPGVGQVGGMALLGATAFGSEAEGAFREGANLNEAVLSSAISAGAEILSERLGGVKFGGKTLTDVAFNKLSGQVTSKLAKVLVSAGKIGADAVAEGGEELFSGYMSAVGQKLTYMEDKEIEELFSDEDKLESFIGGVVLGGTFGTVETAVSGRDAATGLSKSEQAVVDKVVNDTIAEQESEGKTLTNREKTKIRESVVDQMEKGQIDIDTIESVLGGDEYKRYTYHVNSQQRLKNELEELSNIKAGELTRNQQKRLEELEGMNFDDTHQQNVLRKKLDNKLSPMLKDSKLTESYREKERRGQTFEADLSKYKGKQREAVERAINSGVLNNTYRSHELVDVLSKIEADKGISFDYTNNAKLKESGFAVEGKTVNGYANKAKGSVTLNVQSSKAWQSVVGHEITHILEGTDSYSALQNALYEYAESKGELTSRRDALTNMYSGMDADIENELTADLVGDYLFTDKEFINKLTGNRTLFEKVYDEIKYLWNAATGKEKNEIEKVKREFDKAWKELSVEAKEGDGKVQLSVSEIVDEDNNSYGIGVKLDSTLLDDLTHDERVEMVKERVKELGGKPFTAYDGNGNAVNVMIAEAKAKFKNKNGKIIPVNKDLTTKYIDNETKQEAVVLADELILTAKYEDRKAPMYPHGWLDNNGKNNWEYWTTYIQDKNNTIWQATLNIATTADGEKILYDVSPIKKAGRSVKSDTLPADNSISPLPENVNTQFSVSSNGDSEKLSVSDSDSKSGVEYDKTSESYSPIKYSIGSWNESDYVSNRQKAAESMANTLGVTEEKATKYIDDVNSIAKMIADDKERLSYEPSPDRSAFVSNAEYGGSIDFSTICKKRRLFTGTFEAIQNALPNTALTADEVLEIRKMMKDKGYEVSCGLCYVEGSRTNMGLFTKQFIERYAATNPEYVPNMAEMNTATGQEKIRKEHPEVYDAYEYFMNHYGRLSPTDKALFASQQKPKMYQMATEYKGEILNKFGKKNSSVETKNKNGGLRLQSFSDFEIVHLIDSMQVIMDMSRVGLSGQAYTKVPDFAWALGDTGLKINLSLIAKDVDANGKLVLDEVEGMSESDAMALRDRYSDNVGTIIVVFTDTQLKAAMADERIDYIIPYHRSQWKTSQYESMGLPENTQDYTPWQNESYIEDVYDKNGKKLRPDNYMPNTYWDFSKSGKENAEAYLKMCAENNRKPKFSHLLVDNGDGSYSLQPDGSTDGYWKTLIDFKMYNNDGVGVPQKPVIPDFNMDEAKRMLNEYKGGHAKFPVAQDIVDEFVSKHPDNIAPTQNVQSSISNDGEQFEPTGNYSTPLKDLALERDIAPVATTTETKSETAPVDEVTKRREVESVVGGRDTFTSERAMELYDEITSLKKGVRASKSLGYLLDHGYDWGDIKTALLNIKSNPSRVVNPNSAAESLAREMIGGEYDANINSFMDAEGTSADIYAKMKSLRTELDNNISAREQAAADFDAEISQLQEVYDGKKDKNTKTANDLFRRIERVKRLKGTVDADYGKTIERIEKRLEKMGKPEYKTAMHRRAKHDEYTKLMENLVGDTSTWVDKKLGISYKINTLRRNLRDVVRNAKGERDIAKADAIYDELQGKYNHNEAELKRESIRLKESFRELDLNHHEDYYAHMIGEFRYNPDTNLTEEDVKKYYEKHKRKIDKEKVDQSVEEARKVYDELIVRVNERLREQGMKEIPYRKGYFPNFNNPKHGWLARLFNWKTVDTEIPTSIAGLTETFNPERSYQSFDKQRKGNTKDYSLLQGLDTYIHGALDWIYHIEDIQKRRALEDYIRYVHSDEGVKAKIDEIRKSEVYDADEAQRQIDAVYAEANNPLNNFVTNLRAGTNTLANKKSENDRQMESDTNRKIYSVMTNLNNRVSANMVVGSFSSALTNFIPITQSWVEVSPVYSLQGMKDTILSTIRDDGMVRKSDFLTNRLMNEENLYKTGWDKASEKAALMMEAIDSFTSQTVWRSKYLQNISEGMSESAAIENANQFAENVIAGRSRGNMPTIFDAKNPVTKLFTSFQLEVNNQYGYMFKDAPIDSKNKIRLVKGYAAAFLGAYAYNALYSSLVGRDAAFDPISIIEDLFKDIFDDDEKEPEDILLGFTENVLDEVPFVGGLLGGGRVPVSSAIPYGGDYESFIRDAANAELSVKEMLKPIYYLAMPFGGGQIKKFNEGMGMFSDEHPVSGSYTESGKLRFPVEDTPLNRMQAAAFGQYASKNAREYFDNDYAPLDEKQIQEYIDVDIPIRDYREYQEGLKGLGKVDEKFDYISGLDLPVSKKNILINNVVDRKDHVDLEGYEDYSDYEEFDFATKNPEKWEFLQANSVSYDEYNASDESKDAYTWAYKNPESYTLSKAVSDDVVTYRQYASDLDKIHADKDANGKTIKDSRKAKVIEYINGLDIEYGAKLVMYRYQYDGDDTYNQEIVEYINSRDDFTYEDKVTILTKLGFRVEADGQIYAD